MLDKYQQRNYRNLFLVNQDKFWNKWNTILGKRNKSQEDEAINELAMVLIKKILGGKQYRLF